MDELPYIDSHAAAVAVPPEALYDTITASLPRLGGGRVAQIYARLIGCQDTGAGGGPVGFHVAEAERPGLIVLRGRHRFSRYELRFVIEPDAPQGSRLRAETRAAFPGPLGAAYRAAVIGTRFHVLAVRRILDAIRRRAER